MNIALTAIIIIILLLPGASVLKAYYTSIKEKKSVIYIPFTDLLFRGLIVSFIIHSCAICVIRAFGLQIDFMLLYNLLISKQIVFGNEQFTNSVLNFFFYNFILVLISFFSAKYFKYVIQKNNIDLNYYSFRNTNHWFQVFSARYLESTGVQGEREKTDLLYLDILADGDIIYSGFLIDFNYSPEKDKLENIVLVNARKRGFHLSTDHNNPILTGRPADIPGDVLLIPAEKIININIYYMNIDINHTSAKDKS